MKGINFSLRPKRLKHEEYLLNFELLFRDMSKFDDNDNLNLLKCELSNLAYSTLSVYNRKRKKFENITNIEFEALQQLSVLKDVIIQKADKDNVIVLVIRK